MTCMILLQSVIPNTKEIKDYDMKLAVVARDELISKADFAKVEAWFDGSEGSAQRNGAEPFDRATMIKELLFEVHKDPAKDAVHKTSFVKLLLPESIPNIQDLAVRAAKYVDLLFDPANPPQ